MVVVGEKRPVPKRLGFMSPALLVPLLAIAILGEFFIAGSFSYSRLGDNQDSFLSRGFTYLETPALGWNSGTVFGISADYVTYRDWTLSQLVFRLVPLDWVQPVLFAMLLSLSSFFLLRYLKSMRVSGPSAIAALAFLWIYMAGHDLFWYVVAWSLVPLILWLMDFQGSSFRRFLRGILAGLVFVISNYLALTAPYVLFFILAHIFIVDRAKLLPETRRPLLTILPFLGVSLAGFLPSALVLLSHLSVSSRLEGLYYDYGLSGALRLALELSDYFWPAFLATGVLLVAQSRVKRAGRSRTLATAILFFLFFFGFASQFYGFIAGLWPDQSGLLENVPLQRFALILPLLTALTLPIVLSNSDVVTSSRPPHILGRKLPLLVMVGVTLLIVPQFVHVKELHLRNWASNSNLGWSRSDSWEAIYDERNSTRIAVISSPADGFFDGSAQLAGFRTAGGDETVTRNFRRFWSLADLSIDRLPNHSYYFGWTNSDKFRTEAIEDLIDIQLLGKVGVRYVVSAFELKSNILREVKSPAWVSEGANPISSGPSFEEKFTASVARIRGERQLYIYQLPSVKPFAWIAGTVEGNPSNWDSCVASSQCAFVSQPTGGHQSGSHSDRLVQVAPQGNGWKISVSPGAEGLLVVNESWSNQWRAKVNNEVLTPIVVFENFQGYPVGPEETTLFIEFARIPAEFSLWGLAQ